MNSTDFIENLRLNKKQMETKMKVFTKEDQLRLKNKFEATKEVLLKDKTKGKLLRFPEIKQELVRRAK